MYDKKKSVRTLISYLWSFWARLVQALIFPTCGHFGQGGFSLLIIRAPLVQRMYLSGQRKMDFLSNIVPLPAKTKVCVLSNKEFAVVYQ